MRYELLTRGGAVVYLLKSAEIARGNVCCETTHVRTLAADFDRSVGTLAFAADSAPQEQTPLRHCRKQQKGPPPIHTKHSL